MRTEVIDSFDRLSSLHDRWMALWQEDPLATPFQHPEWLLTWWRHFGSGTLFTIANWRGERLVGLTPLFLHEWQGRRQVTLVGNGLSDRLGVIAVAEARRQVVAALLRELRSCRTEWDRTELRDLDEACPLGNKACSPCMAVDLPVPQLSANLRRNLARYRRRLEQQGPLQVESVSAREILQIVAWQNRRADCALTGAGAFLVEAFAALKAANLASVRALTLRGRAIAVNALALVKGRAYGCLTGYDPGHAAGMPGLILLEDSMAHAAATCRTFDFLRGEENYKLRWGAMRYWTHARRLTSGGMAEEEGFEPPSAFRR